MGIVYLGWNFFYWNNKNIKLYKLIIIYFLKKKISFNHLLILFIIINFLYIFNYINIYLITEIWVWVCIELKLGVGVGFGAGVKNTVCRLF